MRTNSERTRDQTQDQTETQRRTNRVTVADAAQLLGLSAEAVRMRIKRGTLASEKVKGSVYVLLDSDPTRTNDAHTGNRTADQTEVTTTDQTALVEALQSEVAFLREELQRREDTHTEENRRKDTIIAQLTQRIPELEPASEPRESPETPSEDADKVDTPPEEEQPRASWWKRLFG
jgi:hypothetical protein